MFDLTYKQRPYTFLLPRKCHSSGGKSFLSASLLGSVCGLHPPCALALILRKKPIFPLVCLCLCSVKDGSNSAERSGAGFALLPLHFPLEGRKKKQQLFPWPFSEQDLEQLFFISRPKIVLLTDFFLDPALDLSTSSPAHPCAHPPLTPAAFPGQCQLEAVSLQPAEGAQAFLYSLLPVGQQNWLSRPAAAP